MYKVDNITTEGLQKFGQTTRNAARFEVSDIRLVVLPWIGL